MPKYDAILSVNIALLLNTTVGVLPSNLRYSVTPPEPSSQSNIISLSSANCLIFKSPVELVINVSVP